MMYMIYLVLVLHSRFLRVMNFQENTALASMTMLITPIPDPGPMEVALARFVFVMRDVAMARGQRLL